MQDPASNVGAAPRAYRPQARSDGARLTRQRITRAASELFAVHGFAGTTVAGVAERAGVAAPTVYATFGSKGAIVAALLEELEQGADADGWFQRIDRERDPRLKLALFAGWTRAILSSSRSVIQAVSGAALDPAVLELRARADRHRREGLRGLIATLGQADALCARLTEERALDRAWMLTDVMLYLDATNGCGWSDDEYEDWLADLLQQQLLSP